MPYAIKKNTRCQAWELGSGSEMERSMISQGRICVHLVGAYEIFSLEAHGGKGQIAKPLKIWRKGDSESEEIRYLLEKGILKIHPENPDRYFSASLRETEESAACDAVIVFFDVKRGAEGKIERINFNFVDAECFQNNYSLMCEEK